jgi:sarcosine oxidase subunit alpha
VRLAPRPGERIDRSTRLSFTFEGRPVEAFAGDTVGSALFAGGRRVFSRSFKYHRKRGLLCCTGSCPNCLMEVDGVPNVRVCTEPAREGAEVRAQNVLGSLDRDLLSVVDRFGGPFTPVGFYYRTMIRPRWAWPYYERILRNVAGLGRLDKHALRARRFDVEHRRADVLVIGGGSAGMGAARAAAAGGEVVVVVDDRSRPDGDGYRVVRGTAIGIYEGGLVPVDAGDVLYRYRAGRIVVAAGVIEQPLVFPGNDLVGVLLPSAVEALVEDWALKPGERAVVVSASEPDVVETLRSAGVEIARVVDLRQAQPKALRARGRGGLLRSVEIDGERISCDLLVIEGSRQPAYSLLAQAGARIDYDPGRGSFVPAELPEGVAWAAPDLAPAALPSPAYGDEGKSFVCVCEDVTVKDLARAVNEGFDSIELAKRYTTATMGPCQGRLCQLALARLLAQATGTGDRSIGPTTARPPWRPVKLGLLAARPHEPAKRTSIHHRHRELGAQMMWTGAWRRPHSYGDAEGEAQNVHEGVGLIDVSTLGKILVRGPDAPAFLERLYPNRFADLAPGRVRYSVLGTDAGRIMDDGTIARLSEEEFYVTATSTGAEAVVEWFEWWNAVWHLQVEIVDLTGALAAVNVAGPHSRELLGRLTGLDVSNEGLKYLDAKRGEVAGVPCLILRIGFVGELGYELHTASPYGEHLWDAILEAGRDLGCRPFGVEPQRILRLEKQHIIVGQDTDSESNPLDAGMPWVVKLDKDDFVGKWSLEHAQARGPREQLVGFVMANGAVPLEGSQVVVDGRPSGRVTSARWSRVLGRAIGLAWLPPELAREGAELTIRVDSRLEPATVSLRPSFDPDGTRQRS